MSEFGENVALQLQEFREENGIPIEFDGGIHYVSKGAVSGAQAGMQGFPKTDLGPAIASLNPHIYVFSAADFQPFTKKYPPKQGSILIDEYEEYKVENYDFSGIQTETHSVYVFAMRNI